MLKLGETKLALDEAVAGDNEDTLDSEDSAPEREMKMSLMNVLRKQLETPQDTSTTVEPIS
jgi:SWI/SNF-related matrix-associated actin-dependent regulator 1 of chromatin subfamily A